MLVVPGHPLVLKTTCFYRLCIPGNLSVPGRSWALLCPVSARPFPLPLLALHRVLSSLKLVVSSSASPSQSTRMCVAGKGRVTLSPTASHPHRPLSSFLPPPPGSAQ